MTVGFRGKVFAAALGVAAAALALATAITAWELRGEERIGHRAAAARPGAC